MISSATDENNGAWQVLIVDDEKDVHEVSVLSLKRRVWRKRPFELVSAYSAREAIDLLAKSSPNRFQVALIDVVMETSTAGLDLCRQLRADFPPSLRIVLRTGQPGIAPEERVINEYDIDYYLAKDEVTPDRLYATVRSCLRSSQDIDTLLAFSRQLRNFTTALQHITTDEDLMIFMHEGLRFLELKHQVRVSFVKSVDEQPAGAAEQAIRLGHKLQLEHGKMLPAKTVGIEEGHIMLFNVQPEGFDGAIHGGFLITQVQSGFMVHALQNDVTLFMQNWTIAQSALLLQQRVAREKIINERMYIERIEGIATMVTGVAHEINTPLGVATTANGMVSSLAKEIGETPQGPELDALIGDLRESTALLSKNLERASHLIRSFKQLSASQLSDERVSTDIADVMRDCFDTMSVETNRRKIVMRTNFPVAVEFPWIGFPGHLSQVLVNFIQNTLRYAYKADGIVDIRLAADGDDYRIEFEDYGAGVAPEVLPKLFQAFVTSGRAIGGTGLGLAIAHNIVTNLLSGQITCTSVTGKGTKFVLVIPRVVPE